MLENLHSDAGLTLLGFRDVLVVVWRQTPTQSALGRLAALLNPFAARHPAGVAIIVVIEEGLAMPEGPVRERMARDMKRHEGFTRSMALVFEGQGFMAALVRSAVAGIHLLSRQTVPVKVCGTVDEAAWWTAKVGLSAPVQAAELVSAVAEARRAAQITRRAS
jgi:hypothetical protein